MYTLIQNLFFSTFLLFSIIIPFENSISYLNTFENSLTVEHPSLFEHIEESFDGVKLTYKDYDDDCYFLYMCDNDDNHCPCNYKRRISIVPIAIIGYWTLPIWLPTIINEFRNERFYFDKYPFYSSKGIYKDTNSMSKNGIVHSKYTNISFNHSIKGNNLDFFYQFKDRWAVNLSILNLNEPNLYSKNNKRIKNIMLYNTFSINKSLFVGNPNVDVAIGYGFIDYSSNIYRDYGTTLGYKIRTFFKPIRIEYNVRYANMRDNYLLDSHIVTGYHFNRYSIDFGYKKYKTSEKKIEGATFSFGIWF